MDIHALLEFLQYKGKIVCNQEWGMLSESTRRCISRTSKLLSLINGNSLEATFRNLTNPQATVLDLIISQSWRTFRSVCLSILTFPEDSTILRISKGSPESWTIGGRNWFFKLSSLSTFN